MRRITQQQGFTIVELMIASTVFALVLLLCTMGLIQIGRMYYRGVVGSRVQETARAILDDMSQAIQFSGNTVRPITPNGSSSGFCIGSRRYSYRVTGAVPAGASPALVVDDAPAVCASAGATAQNLGGGLAAGSRNLLGDNMRLLNLSPPTASGNLYTVSVGVAYGDYTLSDPDGGGPLPYECPGLRVGGQFCAISILSTTVQKRI